MQSALREFQLGSGNTNWSITWRRIFHWIKMETSVTIQLVAIPENMSQWKDVPLLVIFDTSIIEKQDAADDKEYELDYSSVTACSKRSTP